MTMKREKLIISLIKDDLVSSKLVNALNESGLYAGDYFLNLSDTIFKLMRFSDSQAAEEVYEHYLELTKKAKYIDFSQSRTHLDKLAQEIYLELTVLQSKTK
jgi:hypothetical protein